MKTKLDLVGRHEDRSLRNSVRTYARRLIERARSFIYEKALPIAGAAVEDTLKPMSLVPTFVSVISGTLGT